MIVRRQTARQPRGTGPVRKWRVRYQEDMHKLRAWAKGWKGLKKLPTQVEALSSKYRSSFVKQRTLI